MDATAHVRVLKLITGEEIVAEVEYPEIDENQFLLIRNPIQLVMQQRPEGGVGVAVIPWATSVEGDIDIDLENILFDASPKKDLEDHYRSINSVIDTGAAKQGLVLPK